MTLDKLDIAILRLLQRDASGSISEIADSVNLSANACWRRIRRLEETGVIRKRVALLDADKLGVGVTVFVSVRAAEHSEKWLENFTSAIRKIPEVVEIYRMAGEIVLMSPESDAAKAEAYFERALAIARAQQAKSWELRAATSMARLWRDQGKRKEARELLAPVYAWFTEGFDTLDLRQAKTLLDELA